MLHPLIKCVNMGVIQGNGLVAQGFIAEGELLYRCELGTEIVQLERYEEVLNWPEPERSYFLKYSYQFDEDLIAFEHEDTRFMNHSCDPNTWSLYGDDNHMVARRDIHPGDEVTYDYATTQVTVPLHLECNCGSANCRGIVTHLDYQKPEWRAIYGSNLPAHVLRAIENYLQPRVKPQP